MTCSKGQRLISPQCHLDFVRMDDLMRSLSAESRTCSECNEVVNLYAFPSDNPGPGQTFEKVTVVGCERMIDSVLETFIEEFDFAACFERKQSQSVSGASH